jgi:hypothetical protein
VIESEVEKRVEQKLTSTKHTGLIVPCGLSIVQTYLLSISAQRALAALSLESAGISTPVDSSTLSHPLSTGSGVSNGYLQAGVEWGMGGGERDGGGGVR